MAFPAGIEPTLYRLGVILDFENDIKTVDFLQISFVLGRFMRAKTPVILRFVKYVSLSKTYFIPFLYRFYVYICFNLNHQTYPIPAD